MTADAGINVPSLAPQPGSKDSGICTMTAADPRWNWSGSVVPCTEPAIGWGFDACVHEHVHHFRVCAGCACELQRGAPDLICPECEDAAESHWCIQTVVLQWDDGTPPTIVREARR